MWTTPPGCTPLKKYYFQQIDQYLTVFGENAADRLLSVRARDPRHSRQKRPSIGLLPENCIFSQVCSPGWFTLDGNGVYPVENLENVVALSFHVLWFPAGIGARKSCIMISTIAGLHNFGNLASNQLGSLNLNFLAFLKVSNDTGLISTKLRPC